MAKQVGQWVSSYRCNNCNSIPDLKKLDDRRKEFEDTGIVEVDGKKTRCPFFCDKGWFYSKGSLS